MSTSDPNFVGNRIRSLRADRSLSVDQLAQRSGLSPLQIQRIDSGEDLPSLAPLIKLARVLEVRLGTLLDDPHLSAPADAASSAAVTPLQPVVCRAGQAEEGAGVSFSNNDLRSRRHMVYHSLAPQGGAVCLQPFAIRLQPTPPDAEFVLSSHEGEEFILVQEGTVEIVYGQQTYLLQPGDSICYPSTCPHHVHGYQGQSALLLAVIYTPQ